MLIHTVPSGFSTGFTWFYWEWYKNKNEIINDAASNENDYGGYQGEIDQLYVAKKYSDYKEELLRHLTIKNYRDIIMPKAKALIASNKGKSIRASFAVRWLHYGISRHAPISINHIISLITYTDCTNYSRVFSSTFRKINVTESMTSVRIRNREFCWQSKLFREAVEIYGSVCYADSDSAGGIFRSGIAGPFYTGVNCQLFIPEFAIRSCAPTSTSMHMEVAMNNNTIK